MIKLTKAQKPQILEDRSAEWTRILLEKFANAVKPTDAERSHYRHPQIKSVLVSETHGKCAYCESKLLHVSYGDVEHITPKSSAPEKTFEWENLTLACDPCNTRKSNKPDIIDPYTTDPLSQFFVYGALIMANPIDQEAIYSETTLGLNRTELLEMREKRIKHLHALVCLYQTSTNPNTKSAIREDIMLRETLDSVEFAAVSRKYVEDMIKDGHL